MVKITIKSEPMQPRISDMKQIILVGVSFYGDPFDVHMEWDEENQIGRLWKRFLALLTLHPELTQKQFQTSPAYEVHIYNAETKEKGLFEVFVGVEYGPEQLGEVPVELSVKTLPAAQYAIFTLTGEQIHSDWEKDIQNWLLASGYQSSHSYNYQYYDERFKGMTNLGESTLDVYIPIHKAA